MLKTLEHLMGDLIAVAQLSERNCFHFKALLTDKTGMNLSNDVTYGYIFADKFNQQNADALLSAFLILLLQTEAS